MKKIVLINLLTFIFSILIIFLVLKSLNYFVSGPPRYYEFVFNLEKGDLRKKKEKLTYYKSISYHKEKEKDDFLKYNTQEYKNFKYSGELKIENCGKTESGVHELIYGTDKNGFRENQNILYEKTDFILLGDSFTMSVCQNKPYDLKSQLIILNKDISYLNLGLAGDNYAKQLITLLNASKNTKFDNLIWFFYEGNDYNDSLDKIEYYKKNYYPNHIQQKKTLVPNTEKNYYKLNYDYEITNVYKLKVFIAEITNGLSSLLKYFKNYENLLNISEYNEALIIANKYLDEKKVKNKYIYYIPSWQKLTNYKSIKSNLFNNNPQIIQLNTLKTSVKETAEKNGFTFIDGEQIFMNLEDPLKVFYYNLNTHFNRLGYRLMAQDLYNKILINK